MVKKNKINHTKETLLDKAETLFSEKGYYGVSVREITAAANCNTGGINYHFGSKKNLYLEVFRLRWVPRERRMYEAFKKSIEGIESPTPRDVIESLARAYLEGSMSQKERRRHRQLIIWELNNPTEAFKVAADQTLRPLFRYMFRLLRPFVPEDKEAKNLVFDIMSIFGIVLYFNYSRPMVSRITNKTYNANLTTWLIENMARFTLNGLDLTENL